MPKDCNIVETLNNLSSHHTLQIDCTLLFNPANIYTRLVEVLLDRERTESINVFSAATFVEALRTSPMLPNPSASWILLLRNAEELLQTDSSVLWTLFHLSHLLVRYDYYERVVGFFFFANHDSAL